MTLKFFIRFSIRDDQKDVFHFSFFVSFVFRFFFVFRFSFFVFRFSFRFLKTFRSEINSKSLCVYTVSRDFGAKNISEIKIMYVLYAIFISNPYRIYSDFSQILNQDENGKNFFSILVEM